MVAHGGSHPVHDVLFKCPESTSDRFPVVIEVPRDGTLKYEIDCSSGLLRLDRALSSAVHYPANYGFVPRTTYYDGDPADALVLSQHSFHPLSVVDVRLIGMLRMIDDGERDDKLITVAVGDPAYTEFTDFDQLSRHWLQTIEQFFNDYKRLEGKIVETSGFVGPYVALGELRAAMARYDSGQLPKGTSDDRR